MEWKQRALRHLVTVEARIRALDHVMYYGAGFHYVKHDEAAHIRRLLTKEPHPDPKMAFVEHAVAEVFLKGLTRDVVKAERTVVRTE